MPRESGLALIFLVVGCAQQRMPETRALAGSANEVELNQVVERAMGADGELEPADSLYAPYATVIADGTVRRRPPRYAGVSEGGEIAITSTQLQSRGAVAWGSVEYRWTSDRSQRAQAGRASLVLVPAQGRDGWWIVQAHSSTVR
ncbi:MAG TPA: hypothetical protein VFZ87_12635 [Gemmatimonadales bacterium]